MKTKRIKELKVGDVFWWNASVYQVKEINGKIIAIYLQRNLATGLKKEFGLKSQARVELIE